MAEREIEMRRRARRRRYRRRQSRRRWVFALAAAAAVVLGVVLLLWRRPAPPPEGGGSPPPASEAPAPTPPPSPKPSPGWSPIAQEEWKLRLVNFQTPLPEDYTIRTTQLTNGLLVDERCYPDLQAMMDACRAEGLRPVICSGYRTFAEQEELFENKVSRLMEEGYGREEAEAEAGTVVAVPGTSEHQLGLAVDIADMDHQLLDTSQEDTRVQKWLMEHCWEYGFILRYPTGKSDLTGIIYEPWHYRYVGKEDAEQIRALDLCLEEYLAGEG